MRPKRLHIFVVIACLVAVWNLVSYFMLVNNNASTKNIDELNDDGSFSLLSKLQTLEKELTRQRVENEQLLKEVRSIKQKSSFVKIRDKEDAKKEQAVQDQKQDPLAASPEKHLGVGPKNGVLPVLMIACDRVTVNRALDSLLKYRKDAKKFPIIVSQDCGHVATANVIQQYVKSHNITHIRQPDLSNIDLKWPQKRFMGYYKIARHYKWALDQVFVTFQFSAVIIVEDDLEVSPDFYEYFEATFPILHRDPLLWCVSAWNDNGKEGMVSDNADLLYRTDFFPGLGWMIERSLWMELRPSWPATFWDDWMRHPQQRQDRQCIRPEVSRTSTFGKKGVSKGLFFEKHLKYIKLNQDAVPFTQRDLSYLYKSSYDEMFQQQVYSAPLAGVDAVKSNHEGQASPIRVEYNSKDSFKKAAKALGIMDDFRAGVPRCAYRGVVSFVLRGRRVYLAPPANWDGYDPSWS